MKRQINMASSKVALKIMVLVLLCLFLILPETAIGFEQKQITVVFRYDDYSSLSPTDMEVKLINAFQKYKMPCTFGVIPYMCAGDIHDPNPQNVVPLTPMKASILKDAIEAHILEVALHGYSHQTIRLKSKGRGNTEFSSLNYDSQKQKIANGKALLEKMLDTQVNTFIPPWNSYDMNTLHALEELGFKNISAGKVGVTTDQSQLRFLPATCLILDLQDAVLAARKSRDVQPIIITLFHPYDFREISMERGTLTYQDFVELLMWVKSQGDIHVRTIGQATEAITDLNSHRFKIYSDFLSSPPSTISPPFLMPRLKYYLSSAAVRDVKIRAWMFSTLFYALILAASVIATTFIGRLVFMRIRVLGIAAKYGSLLLLGLFSIYVLRDLVVGFRGATILICLLGICLGIWVSFHQVWGRSRHRSAR